jgi:hypothetical protein
VDALSFLDRLDDLERDQFLGLYRERIGAQDYEIREFA